MPDQPEIPDPGEEPEDSHEEPKKREKDEDEFKPKKDRPVYEGSEFLAFDNPKEILNRIAETDPLGLADMVEKRLDERFLLLDEYRVTVRAVARTAYGGPNYLGKPPLEEWLMERIDEAINDLILEDSEEDQKGIAPTEPWDDRYAFLAESLGIELEAARKVCIVFNELEDDLRKVFFNVIIQGKSLNRFVAEGNGPPEQAREFLWESLRRVSQPFRGPDGYKLRNWDDLEGEDPYGLFGGFGGQK